MYTNADPGCAVCGRIPTRQLPIRRHVGMILFQRFVKVVKPLCREHGMSITKSFLGKTIVQGWWGVISVFVNVFVVIADLSVLSRYGKLAPPQPRPEQPRPQPSAFAPPTPWGQPGGLPQ